MKVAVLTFMKSAYRLGETIVGVVELNERSSHARVLKVSAVLETHETLPMSVCPLPSPTTGTGIGRGARIQRRSHAEAHASFTLNIQRTTFSLDIPSDASPAFQICVKSLDEKNPGSASDALDGGGLIWKVRLCLLVAVASRAVFARETAGRQQQSVPRAQILIRTLERDGPRGEWGSSWIARSGNAPLQKMDRESSGQLRPPRRTRGRDGQRERRHERESRNERSWSQLLVSSLLGGHANADVAETVPIQDDGDESYDDRNDSEEERDTNAILEKLETGISTLEEYDGILPDLAGGVGRGVDYLGGEEGWSEVRLETVECEVPVKVFPGNTAFRALDVVFDV